MELNKTILVIEDESAITALLRQAFQKEGFEVSALRDGEQAVATALRLKPILILLDLGLPGIGGLDVCRLLKQKVETRKIPVIFLTGKQSETDIVLGLEMGADDYITKPFHVREVIARIRTVLRRSSRSETEVESVLVSCGPIRMDSSRVEVSVRGSALTLTLAEFKLLRALISVPGHVFTRDQLLDKISDGQTVTLERNIDVHVSSIRKKLGEDASCIIAVRGIGYKARDERALVED